MWQVLRIPSFWWIAISGALVNFNLYAVATFFPPLFGRIHRLGVARAGIATGVIYAVGGVLGGLLAGIWGDRIVRRSRGGRMLVAAGATLLSAPLSYFGIHQGYGQVALAVTLLTVAYGLLNMYYGLVYASIQDIVPPALRGTSMAMYFLVMYLGGASWGTVIIGKLSDGFALRAAHLAGAAGVTETFKAIGLQQALLVVPALSLALGLVLWAGSRTMEKDARENAMRSDASEGGGAVTLNGHVER
jgi:MFS family permease